MSKELITTFYTAFRQKDWRTMQLCYHDDAQFHDPVFQDLTSREVKAMWHMLLDANAGIEVSFDLRDSDEKITACHWEAIYIFSKTGRQVHNRIDAIFEFGDGKILRHRDDFDLWRWSGMALGWSGKLLGWSPLIRNKIRTTAQKRLFRFIAQHPEYSK